MAGEEVILKLYDISRGACTQIARPMGLNLEAIWHSAILVYGIEIFFGGGIVKARPEEVEHQYDMTPLKTIKLGKTQRTLEEIYKWCDDHSHEFSMATYRIIDHNCNHFTDAFAKYLIPESNGIPEDIVNQHKEIERNPLGGFILNMIKRFDNTSPKFMWSVEPDAFESALRKLWEDSNTPHDVVDRAVLKMRRVCAGIVEHATDAKFREVKESDLSDVVNVQFAREAFEVLGFKKSGSMYKLDGNVNAQTLQDLTKHMHLMDSLLNKDHAPVRAGAEAPPENRLPGLIPTFGGDGGLGANIFNFFGGGAQREEPFANQIRSIMEMGFTDLESIKSALSRSSGSISGAVDILTQAFQ